MPRARVGLDTSIAGYQKALYALGVACASYGVAVLLPHGNGLISVYVTAIVLGIQLARTYGRYFASDGGDAGRGGQARSVRRVRRRC